MNILLIYRMYPNTFWSFRHALKFVSKKASFAPLGLLTVAALLPGDWNKKLIDLREIKSFKRNIPKIREISGMNFTSCNYRLFYFFFKFISDPHFCFFRVFIYKRICRRNNDKG